MLRFIGFIIRIIVFKKVELIIIIYNLSIEFYLYRVYLYRK